MATEEVKSTTEVAPPVAEEDTSKAIVVVHPTPEVPPPKVAEKSVQEKADDLCKEIVIARSSALATVEKEKSLSFIRAWEESEKAQMINRAAKKITDVDSWEGIKKAEIENKLRKYEEALEKKKAAYAEKMKNELALIQKQATEKRALLVATRDEEILKVEESGNKYRTLGTLPKKSSFRRLF